MMIGLVSSYIDTIIPKKEFYIDTIIPKKEFYIEEYFKTNISFVPKENSLLQKEILSNSFYECCVIHEHMVYDKLKNNRKPMKQQNYIIANKYDFRTLVETRNGFTTNQKMVCVTIAKGVAKKYECQPTFNLTNTEHGIVIIGIKELNPAEELMEEIKHDCPEISNENIDKVIVRLHITYVDKHAYLTFNFITTGKKNFIVMLDAIPGNTEANWRTRSHCLTYIPPGTVEFLVIYDKDKIDKAIGIVASKQHLPYDFWNTNCLTFALNTYENFVHNDRRKFNTFKDNIMKEVANIHKLDPADLDKDFTPGTKLRKMCGMFPVKAPIYCNSEKSTNIYESTESEHNKKLPNYPPKENKAKIKQKNDVCEKKFKPVVKSAGKYYHAKRSVVTKNCKAISAHSIPLTTHLPQNIGEGEFVCCIIVGDEVNGLNSRLGKKSEEKQNTAK
jgi:hypothetical protein